jgi:hypothetical protein
MKKYFEKFLFYLIISLFSASAASFFVYAWDVTGGTGTGTVTGPTTSTDSHIATFDGSDGSKIKDSGLTAGDLGGSAPSFSNITSGENTGAVMTVTNPGSITGNIFNDARYYPKATVDSLLSSKSSTGHSHDADNTKLNLSGGTMTGNLDLSSYAMAVEIANAGTTGTTLNKLAKLTGAPSTAVIAGTSDTTGVIGVVISGAGTTGNAVIARNGICSCVFDGATTAGDYVQVSSTVAGDCKDAGASPPTSGQIIGRVLSTNGGAGTYAMSIAPPHYGNPWATTSTPVISSAPQPTVTKATSSTLTVTEVLSGSIYLTTASVTNVQSLPQSGATTTGTSMGDGTITCFYCTTAAPLNINPDDVDTLYLDGVSLTAGVSVVNSPAALGDYICVQSTGIVAGSGYRIYTWGYKGVWINGG